MSTTTWVVEIFVAFIAITLLLWTIVRGIRFKRIFEADLRARDERIRALEVKLTDTRSEVLRLTEQNDYLRHRVDLGGDKAPSFGAPELKQYNPMDYPEPLICATCDEPFVVDEYYYRIPITNAGPGAVTGVHLRCERAVPIG
jgi:hypothetical protein